MNSVFSTANISACVVGVLESYMLTGIANATWKGSVGVMVVLSPLAVFK